MRRGVSNPERYHADLAVEIGVIFAELFHHIGLRRSQNVVRPTQFAAVVSERRIQVNGWAMEPPRMGRRAFWGVAFRSADRVRRRWLWELARAKTEAGGPIRTGSGDIMNEHSDDEFIPDDSRENLAAYSSFPLLEANWNISGGE